MLAVFVAAAPEDVPGLTVPDSPEAGRAMESMGMEGSETKGSGSMESESMGSGSMGQMEE